MNLMTQPPGADQAQGDFNEILTVRQAAQELKVSYSHMLRLLKGEVTGPTRSSRPSGPNREPAAVSCARVYKQAAITIAVPPEPAEAALLGTARAGGVSAAGPAPATRPILRTLFTYGGGMKDVNNTHDRSSTVAAAPSEALWNLPINVKEAARFLGVSHQTVYLWVERKQIPHLRVMGRNIRFLRSDLEPFRAQFKHEVANGKTA
jgi:excisionase family DNA binding protein